MSQNMNADAVDIPKRFHNVQHRIVAACNAAGRNAEDVKITAVSKTRPAADILAARAFGQLIFGENRVQEAVGKWQEASPHPAESELRLIGPLQTNKAAIAVQSFDSIESLDRAKLAECLAREVQKQGKQPELYLQINIGVEPQKAGILPQEAAGLLKICQKLDLTISGLMCIPPNGADPTPFFQQLAAMASDFGLKEISMGMSGDFETAILCGATRIRLGSVLFGQRQHAVALQS